MPLAMIVHGGAWDIPDDEVEEHQRGCRAALDAGWAVLAQGGTALDAVEAAVRVLEDAPIFDAGVGSVLNRDGFVELDAALMDGETLRSGGVAALQHVRNPITLARRVLESDAVLLVGPGAERFAESVNIPMCEPSELIVEREVRRWQELQPRGDTRTEDAFRSTDPLANPSDTVGAVALDRHGNLAAGTSTGGTTNKRPGRVGDSPLIGCGLYADNLSGGCSTTGWGESIIKVLLAKTATDFIRQGHAPMEAARAAVDVLEQRVGGLGAASCSMGRAGSVGRLTRRAWPTPTARKAAARRWEYNRWRIICNLMV